MAKRIVVLHVDGTETVLDKVPDLDGIQAIVGGYMELVTVLDHIEPGTRRFIFTRMIINEEGLIHKLPRNPKATEIYQRNVRAQFPDAENPFLRAKYEFEQRAKARGMTVISSPWTENPEYSIDPWIAGPAILFEGYTVEEAGEAMGD